MIFVVQPNCQPSEPFAIAVAGTAGSGKSTLGRAIAQKLAAPLVDLDTATNPLLDRLPESIFGGHWLASSIAPDIRDGRYAALRSIAQDVLDTSGRAVLVAPFTVELSSATSWNQLRQQLRPANVTVVQIVGDPELFSARRMKRAEARDRHRPHTPDCNRQLVAPTIDIDAELTTEQQVARVMPQLGWRTKLESTHPLFGHPFRGLLVALEGTLIDSTASTMRCWRHFVEDNGFSADDAVPRPGLGARESVALLVPPDHRQEATNALERLLILDAPSVPLSRGADQLLAGVPPHLRAIVATESELVSQARLASAGVDSPGVLLTSDDLEPAIPDLQRYRNAASRLHIDPSTCLVIVDNELGLNSAQSLGCRTVAVLGTSPPVTLNGADLVIDGLDRLHFLSDKDSLRVTPAR